MGKVLHNRVLDFKCHSGAAGGECKVYDTLAASELVDAQKQNYLSHLPALQGKYQRCFGRRCSGPLVMHSEETKQPFMWG